MPQPSAHPHEGERLAVLHSYGILDTPRESDFDEIVEILASACDVPISLVSLVDHDRQWFKAETGLGGIRETPMDSSICGHAILQDETLVVTDARDDPRFADNPLVSGAPGLRFYAGARLDSPEGMPLGTLCILDYKPRILEERQKRLLGLMAKQVMAQLELRRALKREREARAASDAALAENRLLALEIDHRVKNSLQLVSSMLRLQAKRATEGVAEQLLEADRRVRSIAIVHDQLYRAGSSAGVDGCEFITSLCREVGETRPPAVEVVCTCDAGRMSPDQAASLGLIVNELMVNAFKHAFPDVQAGHVWVELRMAPEGFKLSIADDGKGYDLAASASGLGTRLISAFVNRLNGTLTTRPNNPGTVSIVEFPVSPNHS